MRTQNTNILSKTASQMMGIFFWAHFWAKSPEKNSISFREYPCMSSEDFQCTDLRIYAPHTNFLHKGAIYSMGNLCSPQILADFGEINFIIDYKVLFTASYSRKKIKASWSRYNFYITSQNCPNSPGTSHESNGAKLMQMMENNTSKIILWYQR